MFIFALLLKLFGATLPSRYLARARGIGTALPAFGTSVAQHATPGHFMQPKGRFSPPSNQLVSNEEFNILNVYLTI